MVKVKLGLGLLLGLEPKTNGLLWFGDGWGGCASGCANCCDCLMSKIDGLLVGRVELVLVEPVVLLVVVVVVEFDG